MEEPYETMDDISVEMEGFIEARPLTALAVAIVLGALVGRRLFKSARQDPSS